VNILTKICIVVLVLLSVFSGVVFSHQALVGPKYKLAYEREQQQRMVLETNLHNARLAHGDAQDELADLRIRLEQTSGELQGKIQSLMVELTDKNSLIDQLEDNYDQLVLRLDGLKGSLDLSESQRKLMAEQLKELDTKYDRMQAEYTSVQNHLAAAQARIERDAGEIRVLREQIVQREEEIELLVAKVQSLGGVTEAEEVVVYTPEDLTATITAVQANGLASINIGQVNGVREGMVMYIYRGSDFVGHLRIEEVDDSASAGVIFEVREGMSVQQGDKVTSQLN